MQPQDTEDSEAEEAFLDGEMKLERDSNEPVPCGFREGWLARTERWILGWLADSKSDPSQFGCDGGRGCWGTAVAIPPGRFG